MRKIRLLERRLLAAATTRAGWKETDRDETGAKAAPEAHTEANANAKRVRLRFIMANVLNLSRSFKDQGCLSDDDLSMFLLSVSALGVRQLT
jgi:hypothetical protein